MCGRYTLVKKPESKSIGAQIPPAEDENENPFQPRYNIAPTQQAPVLTADGRLHLMRWGLIPFWAKDESIGARMINARAETIHEKPAFKRLVKTKRCLVPADGFFEWQKRGSAKQPIYFQLRDRSVFTFAGLWDSWTSTEGKPVESFTIITTEANACVRPVHDRMPVILRPEQARIWQSVCNDNPQAFSDLLGPFDAQAMMAYPVRPIVNSVKNDVPACIEPLPQSPPEPTPLNLDLPFD